MTDSHIPRLNAALEGRYTIERELGEGGMATVYVADDIRHDRKVAIKVLRPELAAVIGGERFLAEIKTTANLQHPHVLPLFDSGEADGFLFYVMPLLEGDSLRDRITRDRQLPVDDALRIAKAVASALDYAHRQGVIHRDIKPANILLQDGQPVVADFGIALAVSAAGAGRMTETGLSVGTPSYMSPEQATADQDPGPQSDVYSLGCVLYEMLTGEPPYTGSSAQAILGKIIMGNPTLPTEHRPAVPAHVEAVLLKALEKLPADRFQTADGFAKALDDTALTHSKQTVSAGAGAGASKPWISYPASKVSVVLAFVATVLAVVASLGSEGPPPVLPLAQVAVETVSRTAAFSMLSPDGAWLATQRWNARSVTLRNLENETSRVIDLSSDGHIGAFSPDSRSLLIGGIGLQKLPVDGGAAETILSDSVSTALQWTAEDDIVFSTLGGVYKIPAAGGEPIRLLDRGFLETWLPQLLPGGRYLVYDVRGTSADAEIRIRDLQTDEDRPLVADGFNPQYVHTGHLVFGRMDQTVMAAAIDIDRGVLTSQPKLVQDSVYATEQPYPASFFDVSASGWATFLRGDPAGVQATRRIFMVDRAGNEEIIPLEAGAISLPSLSPDGRTLLYRRDNAVWAYDLVTGASWRVSPENSLGAAALWSPDGAKIAYTVIESSTSVIHVQGSEPGAVPQRIALDRGWVGPTDWLPGGDGLLLITGSTLTASEFDIEVVRFGQDTVITPYLPAAWSDDFGSISPNGAWVAYRSNQSGEYRLYVRSFPEPEPPIQISPVGMAPNNGGTPVWDPSGDFIYWRSGDAVMATAVSGEPEFQVGETEVLFRGRFNTTFDLAPDGRFIMAGFPLDTLADGTPAVPIERRVILAVNWVEKLKAIMGEGN